MSTNELTQQIVCALFERLARALTVLDDNITDPTEETQ